MDLLKLAQNIKKYELLEDLDLAAKKLKAVGDMIEEKFMIADSKNYHVAMLDNLWMFYQGDKQISFCENLKFYCDMKNALNDDPVNKDAILLISLKDADDNVRPHVYFQNKKVIPFTK